MTPQRYRRIRAVLDRRQPDLTLLLEGVHKPHNLSAIQRTCDAVGVLDLHAVAPARPYRAHRATASGSEKWTRVHRYQALQPAIDRLRRAGFQLWAANLSERSRDFRELDYRGPVAIVMGTEKFGVSAAACAAADGEIHIPMLGMVASLNVSVAAAVILYEAQRQREQAGLYDRPRLSPERYQALLFRWGYPRLAARYDALGLPYPELDEEGNVHTPIPEAVRRVRP